MKVKELIAVLQTHDPEMLVVVLTDDGNGHCHEPPQVQRKDELIVSIGSPPQYQELEIQIVEIS